MKINDRLIRDERPIERAGSLALPPDLAAVLAQVHGAEVAAAFAVPADYGEFARLHGGGLHTLTRDGEPDEFGWDVFSFSGALARTAGSYAMVLDSDDEEERAEHTAAIRQAGIWLTIGRHGDKHEHFLCCDGTLPVFGQIRDVNDGDQVSGLIYDRVWASFTDYIAGRP